MAQQTIHHIPKHGIWPGGEDERVRAAYDAMPDRPGRREVQLNREDR